MMVQSQERLIKSTPIFKWVDERTLQRISAAAVLRNFSRGEFLVHQGEIWPYIFLVSRGVIVAEKDSLDGKTLVAATFGTGDMFWGLAFFLDGSPMPAAFKVFEDGQILLWSRNDMEPILKENGSLSWELGKLAVKRMVTASEIIESMTFHPIAVRLARLLTGISNSNQTSIERSLTLDEMAARIGSTREMVCRLLYKFSDEGLIKITRTEFTITDVEALNQKAQR